MTSPFSLEGKTILVTGASSGIGRATAIECAKMGAKIIVSGRDCDRLEETLLQMEGDNHKKIIADLSTEVGIAHLVNNIPQLDGVVLSQGITQPSLIQFATLEKFRKLFDVNFFSQTEVSRLLYKKKKLKDFASVVVIASIGGLTSFNYGNCMYGCSKAALDAFMKYASREFATRNIRVNCICPGMIETPLIRNGAFSEEQYQEYRRRYPLKRFGRPEEVAYGAIYLLSDASGWTTGSNLFIDGGGDSQVS